MDDLISRQAAIDAVLDRMNVEKHGRNAKPEEMQWTLEQLPSVHPKLPENWWKTDHGYMWLCPHCGLPGHSDFEECLRCGTKRPSAQPFHNITMNDVLKYIDGMPEDVWQEFTACLECRGWELQRRTAKWCGSEFA